MTYDLSRLTQDLPPERVEPTSKQPENGRILNNYGRRLTSISRSSSIDSVTDVHLPDYFSSDELDKLSSCLSEAELEWADKHADDGSELDDDVDVDGDDDYDDDDDEIGNVTVARRKCYPASSSASSWPYVDAPLGDVASDNSYAPRADDADEGVDGDELWVQVSSEGGGPSTSLLYDIVQAQLALWTCAFSLLYSYAWLQHRKKFLLSVFIVVPTTFALTCALSTLLTTLVVVGRLCSTPVNYKQYLELPKDGSVEYDERDYGGVRQRSYSGASSVSCQDDGLPKPLCRRHSGSHTSLCSRPPSVNRKLSYSYSHYNANGVGDSD